MARVSVVVCVVSAVVLAQCASALNCLFLHGVGQEGPQTGLKDGEIKVMNKNYLRPGINMPEYWGDVGQRMARAGCSSVFGYWTETAQFAWSDKAVQQEYCAAIVATNADVVFTHSMGGPIIAGALYNQLPGCIGRIGQGAAAKTHWYGLQSPFGGSEAAEVLKDVCKNEILAKFAGRCQTNADGSTSISRAYASLLPSNCPAYLKETARKYESGNMCGVLTQNVIAAPDRLGLKDLKLSAERAGMGVGLEFIRASTVAAYTVKGQRVPPDWAAVNLPTKSGSDVPAAGTDGMVGFTSCRTQPVSAYKKSPSNRFYAVEANHGDGRGTFGDDAKTLNFQPIQYMKNMVALTAASKQPNGPPTITPRFQQTRHAVAVADADEDEAQDEAQDEAEDEVEDEAEEEAEAENFVTADDEDEDEAEAEVDDEAAESEDF